MKTSIKELNQVKRQIDVEIEAEKISQKMDQAYQKLSKRIKVKGFRPGRTPRKILEQYYGQEVINDVRDELIKESFSTILEETKLFPLGKPSIEDGAIRPGESFKYSIMMEIRPEFNLKKYMGIPAEKEILNIFEDSVDKKLEEIRQAHARLVSIDEERGVKEGDYVILDYQGFWKGKHLKDINGKDSMVLVGDKNVYPELEKGILGLKKEEEKDIEIEFKEDFHDSRLAGKKVTFHIVIRDIKRKDLPEINDEFAKSLSQDFKSLEDVRERLDKDIRLQEEKRIDRELKKRLLKKIASKVDFELPQVMVDNEIELSLAAIKHKFRRSGSRFELAGISEEEMRNNLRTAAEEKVKEDLVLSKIADMEDIRVEDSDVRNGFQELSAQIGKGPDILQQYYEKNNLMDSFINQLLVEKILNHLVQGAKITEVKELTETNEKERKETEFYVNTDSGGTKLKR